MPPPTAATSTIGKPNRVTIDRPRASGPEGGVGVRSATRRSVMRGRADSIRRSVRRAFLLWLVIFAAFATTIGLPASPGNDLSESEAQTLLVTESIVSDGD